jgi:hypothetical protein
MKDAVGYAAHKRQATILIVALHASVRFPFGEVDQTLPSNQLAGGVDEIVCCAEQRLRRRRGD